MTVYGTQVQDLLNDQHATNPQVGDYWHEMFCPVCLVCEVTDDVVRYATERVDVDKDHWTFDKNSFLKTADRKAFKRWLRYDKIDGFWCDVAPRRAVETAEILRAAAEIGKGMES